jgi:hypothetical protein
MWSQQFTYWSTLAMPSDDQKPRPWWEEYLGLKIRFQLLKPKPKRAWRTIGAYIAWIVPGALLSLLPSWLGVHQTTPIHARPKEVHLASQLHADEAVQEARVLAAVGASANLSVNVWDGVKVSYEESAYIQTYPPKTD